MQFNQLHVLRELKTNSPDSLYLLAVALCELEDTLSVKHNVDHLTKQYGTRLTKVIDQYRERGSD